MGRPSSGACAAIPRSSSAVLNASACARSALALARGSGASIGIVCAGWLGGFTIDDALAAGYLVDRLLAAAGDNVELTAAQAARRLWHMTPDIGAAFRSSISGQLLSQHQLDEDVAFCPATDSSEVAPVLVRGTPMRLERLISVFMSFPTVGMIDADSHYRKNLEESGLGFDVEVRVLRLAHDVGYLTVGYCFTPSEARMLAEAGVDIVACHAGLASGGLIGAASVMSLDDAVKTTTALINAAKEVRPELDFLPITHGGPMADPTSTTYVMERTEAVGYLGASSIERTPVEPAVIGICRDFKAKPVNVPAWVKTKELVAA
jgi:Phosphoenolpyruvate hydrolase-like/2-phosphosulpholactate phosphatase